jgi:hypothetical protein
MSDKLMDTEPGGEQTQYEGVHTFVEPHAKQTGQLGGAFLVSLPLSPNTRPRLFVYVLYYYHWPFPALDPSTHTSTEPPKAPVDEPNTQGVTKADKIRYGQSIQEGGMGGKTTSSTGEANGGGFGGTKKMEEEDDSFSKERREQGYGGGKDMDRNIGAWINKSNE